MQSALLDPAPVLLAAGASANTTGKVFTPSVQKLSAEPTGTLVSAKMAEATMSLKACNVVMACRS